ncbi:hypothetical protein VNO78_02607 [Psophocarpus tetragonolobus]|uniref:Uncharacterized protein n=1 Tax=Psophocarpus tetragonolobus TaxID=3891 RepID=A0AAN9T0M3_PSOTE
MLRANHIKIGKPKRKLTRLQELKYEQHQQYKRDLTYTMYYLSSATIINQNIVNVFSGNNSIKEVAYSSKAKRVVVTSISV